MGQVVGTAKVRIHSQVAREFGYNEDIVKSFLRKKRYHCAADLIEDLENYESKEEEEKEDNKNNGDDNAAAAAASVASNSVKKSTLREETEELFRKSVCLVCNSAKRTRVCLPCCHLTHCDKCESSVKVCPYLNCRETVRDTIHTFL